MTTTLSPIRLDAIPPLDMGELRDGLSNAVSGKNAALDAASDEWDYDGPNGDHPGLLAWDAMVNEAIAEILPDVATMLRAAIERRLPWTWEPDDR